MQISNARGNWAELERDEKGNLLTGEGRNEANFYFEAIGHDPAEVGHLASLIDENFITHIVHESGALKVSIFTARKVALDTQAASAAAQAAKNANAAAKKQADDEFKAQLDAAFEQGRKQALLEQAKAAGAAAAVPGPIAPPPNEK